MVYRQGPSPCRKSSLRNRSTQKKARAQSRSRSYRLDAWTLLSRYATGRFLGGVIRIASRIRRVLDDLLTRNLAGMKCGCKDGNCRRWAISHPRIALDGEPPPGQP